MVSASGDAAFSWQGAFGTVFRHWTAAGALEYNLFLSKREAFVLTAHLSLGSGTRGLVNGIICN